ncbi:hypothetical protein E4U19_003783 [Claviceps sp. Clav32 group G5]|nr:hypothetical protein E4U19_003783 [Claviceps sp. Clav32 group G5]
MNGCAHKEARRGSAGASRCEEQRQGERGPAGRARSGNEVDRDEDAERTTEDGKPTRSLTIWWWASRAQTEPSPPFRAREYLAVAIMANGIVTGSPNTTSRLGAVAAPRLTTKESATGRDALLQIN